MSRLRLRATPVGDALLIHEKGRIDERAAGFAAGLSRDAQHTLVIVDLPAGMVADEWRAVAKVLSSSRYGSLRMVFGRDRGEDVRRAAGLIAERLGRDVIACDGALAPTVTGGLYAPGDDSSWIRFRPGQSPEPGSRRFPKPEWEFSLPVRARAVSPSTTAQPVPCGVWLRHTDRDRLGVDHRRTVETVPTDPHRLLVVLGSPDTPPLPVDDVARYWQSVRPEARSTVRFHLYGTLDAPESLAPGQCLADILDHEVVLYARLPSGLPSSGDDDTLAYVPARSSSVLQPSRQSGEEGAPGAATTADRAAPATLAHPDAVTPAAGPAARNELGGATPAGVAGGSEITTGAGAPARADVPAGPATVRSPDAPVLPRVQTVTGNTTPPTAAVRGVLAPSAPRTPTSADFARHSGQDGDPPAGPGEITAQVSAAPVLPAVPTTPTTDPYAVPVAEPDRAPAADESADPAPDTGPGSDVSATTVASPVSAPAAEAGSSVIVPASPASPPTPRAVRPAAPRFRLESATPVREMTPEPEPATAPTPAPAPAPPSQASNVRVQPTPRPAACALPPERGIARERDWLRKMLSEQYNAAAASVSRVMSESPGLRGGSKAEAADALTELVAVRLYLSGDSRGADAAVRTAVAGPHVPLARCVTAGLSRLPSYRGPALLRTRLADAERAWYEPGKLVTEWAFCHARTSLHTGPRGADAADILIWSMTARRTSSLDPAFPDRVLFLPGSVFKVLQSVGNTVMLREVPPSEMTKDGRSDAPQVKLDEMALRGLENILDALGKADTDPAAESADPPGLVIAPTSHRTERPEGAKP